MSENPLDDDRSPLWLIIDLLKLGLLAVFPWAYLSFDRTDLANGEVANFRGIRSASVFAVLFYLNTGIGAALFHTQNIIEAFSMPVSAHLFRALTFHLYFPLLATTQSTLQITTLDAGLFSVVLLLTGFVGRKQLTKTKTRQLTQIQGTDNSQYVIPLEETKESEGIDSRRISMNKEQSILVLGQPGVGKTEAIKLLSNQLGAADDEPFVVFDYKSEYREAFDDDDQVVLSLTNSTHKWNLFEEAESERDLKAVGQRLFPEEEAEEAGQNAFFVRGARQVFVATARYMYRSDNFSEPDNSQLAELFEECDYETLYRQLRKGGLGNAVTSYIDPSAPEQAVGVYSYLIQTIEDVFVDDFAAEGDFSIREYMENPQGRKLILDMPQTRSDSVARAFRFFIDRAIQHALADGDRGSYFILDEFARVPHLERIEDLTGAGRAQRAQAILGLQGISQLKSNYEENYAQDILATVPQEILMRPGDSESTEYILSRLGKSQYTTRREKPEKFGEVRPFEQTQETIQEAYPLSEATIQRLETGEAILIVEEGWIRAKLPMWADLPEAVRQTLSAESSDET